MKISLFLTTIVISTLALLSLPANSSINWKTIYIEPSNTIKQGQSVFIRLKSEKNLDNPYLIFKGKKLKIFKQDNGLYRGIIGIDALAKAGSYKIFLKDNSGQLNDEQYLFIIPGKFKAQNITISGEKSNLTPTKDELDKIQKAKNTLSDVAYWVNPPFNSPVNGCMISQYGLIRYHNGIPTGDYHKGIDIKAPKGTPIRSIAGGKVLIAKQFRLHGGTVAIDHGQGLTSIYLHMSKITTRQGQIVTQNQKIGEVGSTGFATGPHLHYGIYVNGIPVNPEGQWIKLIPGC